MNLAERYLKPGNRIEYRNGEIYYILNENDFLTLDGRMGPQYLNKETFESTLLSEYDIMKVYPKPGINCNLKKLIDVTGVTPIWTRSVIMTIPEIEDCLGIERGGLIIKS